MPSSCSCRFNRHMSSVNVSFLVMSTTTMLLPAILSASKQYHGGKDPKESEAEVSQRANQPKPNNSPNNPHPILQPQNAAGYLPLLRDSRSLPFGFCPIPATRRRLRLSGYGSFFYLFGSCSSSPASLLCSHWPLTACSCGSSSRHTRTSLV